MDFTSLEFLLFLPIVLSVHKLIPAKKWIWLLMMSFYFYCCWNSRYLPLLLFTILLNYLCALGIAGARDERKRKFFLIASLTGSLGLLFVFKYFNFVGGMINEAYMTFDLPRIAPVLHVALPVGISFYTFQALGYTIDVFRKKIPVEKNLGLFALFVSFFPQLVAGPIERAEHLLPQFKRSIKIDYEKISSGFTLVLWGFFKKMVIADQLAVYVDNVYNHADHYQGLPLLAATYFFAIQIYCDFSGYSDIAIGTAGMLGYDLSQNFDRPYFSRSIPEFWRRWHMTLMGWFKDYVYIPLGGNRRGEKRKYLNQFCVFLVSGLWHGANLTFVIWGIYHGILQIITIATEPLRGKFLKSIGIGTGTRDILGGILTFNLVCLGWIFFRSTNLHASFYILANLFRGGFSWVAMAQPIGDDKLAVDLLLAGLLLMIEMLQSNKFFSDYVRSAPVLLRFATYGCLIIGILLLGVFQETPFLYFQF